MSHLLCFMYGPARLTAQEITDDYSFDSLLKETSFSEVELSSSTSTRKWSVAISHPVAISSLDTSSAVHRPAQFSAMDDVSLKIFTNAS